MSAPARRWDDLVPRLLTAAVLVAIGAAAIWLGGLWFIALAAAAAGTMIWELSRMLAPDQDEHAIILGGLGALAVGTLMILGAVAAAIFTLAVVGFGLFLMPRDRHLFALYALAIILGAMGLVAIRINAGPVWLLWLVLIVVASDSFGYLFGRLIGGAKFWPRISPKKTWSGTIAGWIGGALVAWAFLPVLGGGWQMVLVAATLALAGQMGDIAESALKRRVGVKDASGILPGHGGVMDRFDALTGAALAFMLILALRGGEVPA